MTTTTGLTYLWNRIGEAWRRIHGARRAMPLALVMAASAFGGLACGDETVEADEPIGVARSALGSSEEVQDIDTLAKLRAMTLTGNYRLTADITMQSWNSPFVPIGGDGEPFHGSFDGNSFKIYNLRVVAGQNQDAGLFGAIQDALLTKVALVNVNVSGSSSVGAIVGRTYNSELTDSYVSGGTVTGTSTGWGTSVGMAVGLSQHATRIRRCFATGTVTGRAEYIGGFIGRIFTYGEPNAYEDPRVWVQEVFTNVNVSPTIPAAAGNIYAGGLVGHVHGADIQDINVVGPVLGRGYAGGVVGYIVNNEPASSRSVLVDTISRGVVTVSGTPNRAGAIGFNIGTFAYCGGYNFWDNQTDGGSPPPMDEAGCQQGKTTSQLRSPHPSPNKLINPYHHGELVTQAMINDPNLQFEQCHLGSGSDSDWGFNTCGATAIWTLNSDMQYNTLARIPTPEVQPK
jgi:hypothetical protein